VKKYYARREALVWNTRLRMDRGVGIAGNGMDLLNGQTTKYDSIALERGRHCLQSTGQGLRIEGCRLPFLDLDIYHTFVIWPHCPDKLEDFLHRLNSIHSVHHGNRM
jgi:hypothetical protein